MRAIIQSCWLKVVALLLLMGLSLGGMPSSAAALSVSGQELLVAPALKQNLDSSSPFASTIDIHHIPQVLAWFWIFRSPKSDTGELPETTSGGTRGKCNALSQKLTAIVPPLEKPIVDSEGHSKQSKALFGSTADASPKLWFYIPRLPADVEGAELMLQVRQDNEKNRDAIAQPIFIENIPRESGIFGLDLDTLDGSGIALAPEKLYSWYFSLVCYPERPSRNPSATGWIKYEPYDQRSGLDTLSNRQRIEKYINDGLWHDALTLAAKLHCQSDATGVNNADWTDLLKSIGLEDDVAQADILQCSGLF
ncbi:DUF928 domain-containing protein [Leptothoe kymatousa]|uniref:DUF928 domain-containing protein n=1 Tax=Leptothoe kymatousa TAU-MAC 1615 TaxID=2364775 RepID=A0ABS5Y8U2_9CYAN|nr:DUF928 domain-containing protein [Leptothoe kymatousa]MBT9313784.1 DUF928 domain-containing protein [Leptothoe kymatousa TAU-MAC 1615]